MLDWTLLLLQFIASQVHSFPGNHTLPNSINTTIVRLQDNALQQMKDEGDYVCIGYSTNRIHTDSTIM